MNKPPAHLLKRHFDTAFAAPGDFTQLRERIFSLAVGCLLWHGAMISGWA